MNIEALNQEKQHLIVVDLDGTILPDFTNVDQKAAKVLRKLKEKGHKVCIATGRNYLSTLPIYKEVGLDSLLITYNGAYINHPLKKDNPALAVIAIANSIIGKILTEKTIRDNLLNVMVDSIDRQSISTSDDIYYQQVFFNGNPYKKVGKSGTETTKNSPVDIANFLERLQGQDVLQLVLEFPNKTSLVDNIIRTLRKNYKSSITFYCGEKLKAEREGENILVPDHTRQIIKIRNYNANKGEATKLVAGYYNISLNHTIAFGNDINDIEMMNKVGIGVAVSNSANNLKAYVHDITEFDSRSGGVAKYLIDYFGLK
ncbi:4238_t:CDS:1 [Funneliformis geosporum]|nr:4238_t:CDS:1 [Funneliformis geosporum]